MALSGAIYAKSLRVSQHRMEAGQLVNLVSNDVQRFNNVVNYAIAAIPSLPVSLFGTILLCWFMHSWYPVLGLVVCLLVMFVQVCVHIYNI